MNRLLRKEKKQTEEVPTSQPTSAPNPRSNSEEEGGDVFEARRSTRISSVKADGDTWCETLAVCQVSGKLTVRSYYTNQRTSGRVWDEPPSGASTVEHATEEMRKMAQVQLEEMQIIADVAEDEKKTQKRGLFFGRSKTKQPRGKIQYKPGSLLRNRKPPPDSIVGNEATDPHIQAAIALSMADQSGIERSTFQGDNKNAQYQAEADEELAMAMALSLSENPDTATPQGDGDLLGLASVPKDPDPVVVATVSPSGVDKYTSGDLLGFDQPEAATSTGTTQSETQQQPSGNLKQWPPA